MLFPGPRRYSPAKCAPGTGNPIRSAGLVRPQVRSAADEAVGEAGDGNAVIDGGSTWLGMEIHLRWIGQLGFRCVAQEKVVLDVNLSRSHSVVNRGAIVVEKGVVVDL